MAQEFTIKSSTIEDKINQLLPSQGGFEPGVDFSASTMVIPIVDLTETAEGSTLRQDLQTSISLDSATVFDISNTTTTVINTTGYWRVFGQFNINAGSGARTLTWQLTDGTTTKKILINRQLATSFAGIPSVFFDFIVYLKAGDSLQGISASSNSSIVGSVRQLADINGNLVNPI